MGDDIEPADIEADAKKPIARLLPGSPLGDAISRWMEQKRSYVHRKVASQSAREQRLKYRAEREADGHTVRMNRIHSHAPQQPGESTADFGKRMHRDRQRKYRGGDAVVRSWTDLSAMTEAEKLDHKREQARIRTRRRREKKEFDSLELTADELAALKVALKELDPAS